MFFTEIIINVRTTISMLEALILNVREGIDPLPQGQTMESLQQSLKKLQEVDSTLSA